MERISYYLLLHVGYFDFYRRYKKCESECVANEKMMQHNSLLDDRGPEQEGRGGRDGREDLFFAGDPIMLKGSKGDCKILLDLRRNSETFMPRPEFS